VAIPASPATRSEAEWLERGRALVLRSDLAGARALFDAAHAEHPASVDIALALAGVLWQAKESERAEAVLSALLAAHPAHVAATFLLAKILKERARMNAVATTVRALFVAAPQPVGTTIQAIELLDDAGRKQDAADLCEGAIAHGSTDPRLYAYSGMLHLQLGDFARVRERYTYAIANSAQAYDWQVANGLASAQRYADASHPDFTLFRDALARGGLSERARASLLFALGKAHDDIGDFERAAAYFRDGNATVAGFTEWSRKNFRRMVAARLDAKPLAERVDAAADCVPIFIVGMPRSGTTLVEQILASHPSVFGAGELRLFDQAAGVVRDRLAGTPDFADLVRRMERDDFGAVGRFYLAALKRHAPEAARITDKMPSNFIFAGLIHLALPDAVIIHTVRDPLDTCVSCFSKQFTEAQAHTYDLAELGRYFGRYRTLMAHWRRVLPPGRILDVRYEDVVDDVEGAARRILAHCGLDWDARCLDFHRTERSVQTASAAQVRKPIYRDAIARWRRYERFLGPLTAELGTSEWRNGE